MYTFKEITEAEHWERITKDAPYPQTTFFGELQLGRNFLVKKFEITKNKKCTGYFQAIIYPLFKGKTSIYLPYGPMLHDTSAELLKELGSFLRDIGESHDAVFVRSDFTPPQSILPEPFVPIPQFSYHTAYHQPRGEWILDITPAPDVLLSEMHKKTRYNLRKALKTDLQTKIYSGSDILPWTPAFIEINKINTQSHQTTTHPNSYFNSLFELLSKNTNNFIAVTAQEGSILAINLFVHSEREVFCPFGASTTKGKKLGAYYHIKWHAILHMKEMGVKQFNWGGISVGMHDEYLAGVTTFKKGFGGSELKHGSLYDVVLQPFWYKLYMLRKRLKK